MFAVINVAECDFTAVYLPAFVGADDFLTAIGVCDMHFSQQQPIGAVIGLLAALKSETAPIPAVAECDLQIAALLQCRGNIVSLVLQPAVVIVAIGRQVFATDFLAVQRGLIQP